MSNTSPPFDFSQFVPGFDFLKNLASGGAKPAAPAGMPSLASWVAPTLSVEELEKRIQELKTVQYWLEQNGHALKATVQALEVQKMTLSTLRGMNVRMEDLASAFSKQASAEPAAAKPEPAAAEPAADADEAPAQQRAGVIDPMQWWGSLTEQFQQIANTALQDAAQLKVPAMAQPVADAVGKAMRGSPSAKTPKPAARTAAAKKTAPKKAPAATRKRTTGGR
jgi:hypothetical protein